MIKEIGVAAGCASSKHQARKLFILQRFIRKSVHVKVRGRGKNDREKSFCGCRKFTNSKFDAGYTEVICNRTSANKRMQGFKSWQN